MDAKYALRVVREKQVKAFCFVGSCLATVEDDAVKTRALELVRMKLLSTITAIDVAIEEIGS
jgi:hypothetical protein